MVKEINGEKWFCCPDCGKKLFKVLDGQSWASGIVTFCKKCKKEIAVEYLRRL